MTSPQDKLREVLKIVLEVAKKHDRHPEETLIAITSAIQSANLAVVDLDTHAAVPKSRLSDIGLRVGRVAHALMNVGARESGEDMKSCSDEIATLLTTKEPEGSNALLSGGAQPPEDA